MCSLSIGEKGLANNLFVGIDHLLLTWFFVHSSLVSYAFGSKTLSQTSFDYGHFSHES